MTSNPGLSRREEIALACHKAKSAYDLFVASPTRNSDPRGSYRAGRGHQGDREMSSSVT